MMIVDYLPLILSALAFSLSAAESAEFDPELEPCINGAVSTSGTFPSQDMANQIYAYLAWSDKMDQPYYLFQVAGEGLSTAYPQH